MSKLTTLVIEKTYHEKMITKDLELIYKKRFFVEDNQIVCLFSMKLCLLIVKAIIKNVYALIINIIYL